MLLINKNERLSTEIAKLRKLGKKINFVPTMGNFHAGHESLFKKSQNKNEICVVSIFVNPLQFEDKIDFKNYPRTLEYDKKILVKEKVDILFLPDKKFIKEKKISTNLGKISKKLCGEFRKGHFEGVAIVIIRFLELIDPDYIFLGEKDFQQTLIVKKIIKDFKFKAKTKIFPTIRDKKELALSSRNKLIKNKYLLTSLLPLTLKKIIKKVKEGDFKLAQFSNYRKFLLNKGIEKVNYLEILKEKNLAKPNGKADVCRIFISVSIEGVNLIDNMLIDVKIKCSNGKISKE